jgi:hypothetical protein
VSTSYTLLYEILLRGSQFTQGSTLPMASKIVLYVSQYIRVDHERLAAFGVRTFLVISQQEWTETMVYCVNYLYIEQT